ncbi:MAG TPA: cytochrome c [Longimicrobiales bacterium]|nr:cytochrome c [Longimicrobiales bacterium]
MTRIAGRIALLSVLLVPLTAASSGGWATVTVEDLPDYFTAGQPVNVAFTIRQHGQELMEGLKPAIEAQAGKLEARAQAAPGKSRGTYVARIVLPQPGTWTLTIRSDFGKYSDVALLPIQAIAPGAALAALSDMERGKRLFVAKGCFTCHQRTDVKGAGKIDVGPTLSGRVLAADYVKRVLADPSIVQNKVGPTRMPNLNLKEREIASLAAFVSTPSHASR